MRKCPRARCCCPTRSRAPPAFRIDNVFVLPGVPQIMQAIFSELKHRLKGGAALLSRSVSCALAEGTLAKELGDLQARYADLEIGSYPYSGAAIRRHPGGARHHRERIVTAVEE